MSLTVLSSPAYFSSSNQLCAQKNEHNVNFGLSGNVAQPQKVVKKVSKFKKVLNKIADHPFLCFLTVLGIVALCYKGEIAKEFFALTHDGFKPGGGSFGGGGASSKW